ncbi:MAG: chemotaxis protein CheB [Sphingomonas sp.]
MIGRNIVVIGASSGGVEALSRIVSDLPADLNASIFIVLHVGATGSRLDQLLARKSLLPVIRPADGEQIVTGRIYVAPPDLHMVLEHGHIRLLRGPKENFSRPAVDPLFRSAAIEFGTRVIGIVLTGHLDDGSAGLMAIKDRGGVAIVQDPGEAVAASMPRSAAACVKVDHLCRLGDIAPLIEGYDPSDLPMPAVPHLMEVEHRLTAMEVFMAEEKELERLGTASPLTCPECGGVLYQLRDDRLLRFRCRVGHAVSARTLLAHLAESRETAVWSSIRALTEEAVLLRQFAARAEGREEIGAEPPDAALLIQSAEKLRAILTDWPGPLIEAD